MGNLNRTIGIKGMHCKSCAAIIEEKLLRLEGVESVEVSFTDEAARVSFDPSKTDTEEITAAIEEAGYKALAGGQAGAWASGNSARTLQRANEGNAALGSRGISAGTIKQGIIYGLVPHTGCIAFIAASVLGATVAVEFFKPLLMNPWFFHILVLVSFVFATVSSAVYLGKNGLLSFRGIKRKKGYLSAMYGITIGINLLLFLGIFPLLANIQTAGALQNSGLIATGGVVLSGAGNNNVPAAGSGLSEITLQVAIPCPGHAPLISGELRKLEGVNSVVYEFPNIFKVSYDAAITPKDEMLALEVFMSYPATVVSEGNAGNGTANLATEGGEGGSTSGSEGTSTGIAGNPKQGFQEVKMEVGAYGYSPSNFTIKQGVPVKWTINVTKLTSCNNKIIAPVLGIEKTLSLGVQTVEFVPDKLGTIQFSCWMGMIRGSFTVEPNNAAGSSTSLPNSGSPATQQYYPAEQGTPKGCGCGG